LAWSVGVGMALRAVTPPYGQPSRGDCLPTAVQPLATTPADWLWLPVHAAIAAPMVCRRVLSVPMMIAVAVVLIVAGWTYELGTVAAHGLPSLVCSASGY
jgi:hypothetical protein